MGSGIYILRLGYVHVQGYVQRDSAGSVVNEIMRMKIEHRVRLTSTCLNFMLWSKF